MRRRPNTSQMELALTGPVGRCPTPLSRATSRRGARGRVVEAPAPRPWSAVVLAVDTARVSGWASYIVGAYKDSGELDTLDEDALAGAVGRSVDLADERGLPVVLVLEAPYGGSVAVVAGLGVARERWLRAWRRAEQALGRVVRVTPSQWRGPVLGSKWVGARRDEVRAHEMRVARALLVRERGAAPLLGHDEAAAVLIGRWAAHAGAVGRCIGRRAVRRSLRAWTEGPDGR